MNIKKTTLATALIGALTMGFAGQAAASVYAGSSLNLSRLSISFVNAGTGAAITNLNPQFSFNVEDSATLNGSTQAFAAGCSSLAGNCGTGAGPVLNVPAANAPGSSVTRADTNYALYGQGTGTFANSNAEITTAQLVDGVPSSSMQVAEAEVLGAGQGQASTNIQSNTTWTFSFTLPDTANMLLSFMANPEMEADVTLVPPYVSGLAQSNITANFTLNKSGTPTQFVNWSPDGVSGNVICVGTTSCTETDPESLNETLGAGPGTSTTSHSLGTAASAFSLDIRGLLPGNYRLTLAGLTSVNVTQVPEPGTLVLLGGALAALGFGGTRRRSLTKAA
jgi:hypothetical protein